MLKRLYRKKILLCIIVIFSLFLIYLIPTKNDTNSIEEELVYVDKDVNTGEIYLLDSNNYLARTEIVITKVDIEEKAKELIEALIIDGKMQDSIPSGFKAIIPSNTKILNLKKYDNIIKVDFSKDLMNTTKENEEKIIEAITYTLTSLNDINGVIIYMEGELLNKLPQSKINLPSTLTRNFGINKEYNITSTKDIEKTTIYYISTFNNKEYYVPVTKINNDSRSKIEIIIDELSSNNVYKSNLMSYLNSNTKIISSNQVDDELIVNFNNGILNDINTNEILEEVIYTVLMSINENYDVKSVIFNVDDKEIYKSVLKSLE